MVYAEPMLQGHETKTSEPGRSIAAQAPTVTKEESMLVREFQCPICAELQVIIRQPMNPERLASVGNRLGAHVSACAVIDLNAWNFGHANDRHDSAARS